jgi:hypothetical protein
VVTSPVILPLLSCDPGKHHVGLALWAPTGPGSTWELQGAKLEEFDHPGEAAAAATDFVGRGRFTVAVEVPQVYSAGFSKGDPNDLIDITLVAGAVLGAGDLTSIWFRPREWKGQVDGDVMITRIRSKLTQKELDRVRLPTKRDGKSVRETVAHNVFDAIGVGLFALKKLKLKRTA